MTSVNLPNRPIGTDARSIAAILANFDAVLAAVNGGIDGDNLVSTVAQQLGLSSSSVVRRGKSIVNTAESVTGSPHAVLATPDRVSNIVVPSGGLLLVSFWAQIVSSSATGTARIYLNNNPVSNVNGPADGQVNSSIANGILVTSPAPNWAGLGGLSLYGDSTVSDDLTNGHPVGEFLPIVVNPGTYTVEMRYEKTAGTVTLSNRKLYVKAEAF